MDEEQKMNTKPLLNNKDEFPDDKILLKVLDKSKVLWDEWVATLSVDFPSASLEWKYYKDGGSWLGKLVQKKKTVCWISVWDKSFKVSFYFTEKNDKDIRNLKIDQSLKDAYFAHKPIGKLKPLIVEVRTKRTLNDVRELIRYKTS